MVSKKNIIKLLQNNGIETTGKTFSELLITALDNNVIKREDIIKEPTEKRSVGRPRKYLKKEGNNNKVVEPNKVTDPKYYRLRTIRMEPVLIKLTNIETNEETIYKSIYQAYIKTKHSWNYYKARDGRIIDGIKIEIIK